MLYNKSVTASKFFPEFYAPLQPITEPAEGVVETPDFVAKSDLRSDSGTHYSPLVSEVEGQSGE